MLESCMALVLSAPCADGTTGVKLAEKVIWIR